MTAVLRPGSSCLRPLPPVTTVPLQPVESLRAGPPCLGRLCL
ncbi:MAG: hypothetical protein OXE79_02195 [Acidimicrobiaceae bacterium]|nr:hypothetical protein [Acidimicrobiaceae bacterium]MCY4175820.1 hypothetical protein [Acidimicrobiaceae bacterium]MCY4280941.1 hypothetical protein [Acidimicrobiaceae bacterium]MCY4294803.1 hypothetical protein [Acidimicrobiaceae bacterium]